MSVEKETHSIFCRIKESANIAQSVATVIAIIVAGIWFIERRESSLKADITHTVVHREIDDKQIWVRVSIEISNKGKRLLDLKYGLFSIHQILPLEPVDIPILKDYRVDWPLIGDHCKRKLNIKIEPGEKDHLDHEFLIPRNVQTVEIYSYFQNPENPDIGWSKSTIYDLIEQGGKSNY
ncbi:MAG: hypothetical protein GY777_02565 [Candidatus Brocadiaceae bacterium]|nr:hypothetical protein [Candidatus Brocadiaceae bacterium]